MTMEKQNTSVMHLAQCSHHDLVWSKHFYRAETAFANTELHEAIHFAKEGYPLKWTNEAAIFLYEFLRKHGEQYEDLKKEIVEGNIDLGATYTSPYTSFVTNEILARQVIYGKKWLEDIFPGLEARVFYNTDVPSLNLQIPQLFKKAGLDYIFMSRSWQFPNIKQNAYSTWESPDGTAINTLFMRHYGDLYFKHFKDEDFISYIENEWLENKDNVKDPLLVFGMDCLLPLNLDKQVATWHKYAQEKGYPEIEYSTMIDGLDRAFDNVKALDNTFKGEWPNSWVYENSSADYQTFKNQRDAEKMLVTAEGLFTWRAVLEGHFKDYDVTRFEKAWRLVMKACHGYAPKEGIDEYRAWYKEAYDRALALQTEGLTWLAKQIKTEGSGQPIMVYNSLSYQRSEYVTVDCTIQSDNIMVHDEDGQLIPSSTTADGKVIFLAKDIQGFGYQTYYLTEGVGDMSQMKEVTLDRYENDYYTIELANGGLKSVYDKETETPLFDTEKFLIGELLIFNYEGHGAGEHINIWQPDPEVINRTKDIHSVWSIKEASDVRVVFEMTTDLSFGTFILDVVLYKDEKKIDFDVQLKNNQAPEKYQVRLAFPINGTDFFRRNSKTDVLYEVPFGQVHVRKDDVLPQFSQYNRNLGLGLQTNTNHIYNNAIRPREVQNYISTLVDHGDKKIKTIISSYNVPWDYQDATTLPRRTPVLQPVLFSNSKPCHWLCSHWRSLGDLSYHFSLFSEEATDQVGTYKKAVGSNTPLHVVNIPNNGEGQLAQHKSFMDITGDSIYITAVKKAEAEDKVVIRYHEGFGQSLDNNLTFNFDVDKAYRASTDERIMEEMPIANNTLTHKVHHHEINTLMIDVKDMAKTYSTPKHLMVTEKKLNNQITLTWQNKDEAKAYIIKHSQDNINWTVIGKCSTKTYKTVVKDGHHFFKVAAVYDDGTSFDSVEVETNVDHIIRQIHTEGTDYEFICCHQYLVTDVGITTYTENGLHDTIGHFMHSYLTKDNPEEDVFVSFEFDRVYDLDELYIWNFQEKVTKDKPNGANPGFKEVRIYHSLDGKHYTQLAHDSQSKNGVYTFAKATEVAINKDRMPASNLQGTNEPVNLDGIKAKFIKFVVSHEAGVGNYGIFEEREEDKGGDRNVFGLAQVLFTYKK
ncbi:hypothetical protein HZI73_04440 [Vallitalea pronyensis]|uniref:Alpha-mannosidase n=1 Tax=Vallitalea pronyensis TaxID=1348613 RepID=A0A8J8SFQ8_9FIRM|nr:glycosyl hydrolase-related protein [Vallitalea pronyensis]QUI21584.1 hypothetical protein HZI73_04440 [Vallitalea pronyensis]